MVGSDAAIQVGKGVDHFKVVVANEDVVNTGTIEYIRALEQEGGQCWCLRRIGNRKVRDILAQLVVVSPGTGVVGVEVSRKYEAFFGST